MKKSLIAITSTSLIFITLLFGGFTSSGAVASPEVKDMPNTKSKVTASFLNVRQGPSTKYNIVCVLKKNDKVEVLGKYGKWLVIFNPKNKCVGFASKNYLKSTETNAKKAIPTTKPKPQPTKMPKPVLENNRKESVNIKQIASKQEIYLLELINKEREKNNIPKLKFDNGVIKTARLKAKDMVAKNYFSHQSPTYGSPFDMMKQFGVNFKTAGENIAGNRTIENAVKAWMNSPGHRKNILNKNFNYNGIGIVESPVYGRVFVQQFLGK